MRYRQVGNALLLLVFVTLTAHAQTSAAPSDVQERRLWDEAFLRQRPAGRRQSPPTSAAPSVAPAAASALVGVTLWRLQPAQPGDDPATVIVGGPGSPQRWRAVRASIAEPLREGDRVRLTIESPRAGYLYVIDRELYAGDRAGEPYLIFPSRRIWGGQNEVQPGRVVEIPDLKDTPPFLTFRRSQPDHVGELVTVVISSRPLPELPARDAPVALPESTVRGWEQQWGVAAQRIEDVSALGRTYTTAERQAGESRARLLTQEEPLPQTMYRLSARPEVPLLLQLQLRMAAGDSN